MSVKEKSLAAALDAVRLKDLPAPLSGSDGYWIEALVLVRKRDMSESYCLARRGGNGLIRYVRDFGTLSPIVADNKERGIYGLLRIYPCEFLDERYMPKSERAVRSLLALHMDAAEVERVMALPKDSREAYIIDAAIDEQRGATARGETKHESPKDVEAFVEEQLEIQRSADYIRDASGTVEAIRDVSLDTLELDLDMDTNTETDTKRKRNGRRSKNT